MERSAGLSEDAALGNLRLGARDWSSMKESMQAQLRVRVFKDLRSVRSSINFRRTVEVLLLGTSQKYTAGLERVVLRDADGLTRLERKKRQLLPGFPLVTGGKR